MSGALNRAAPDPACAVRVSDLWKRYGDIEALRGASFEVASGQIFGLLGPNGAGKTTALECILGLRRPDRGTIQIHGWDVRAQGREAKLLAGAQLQAASLPDKITPREALELFGSFYAEPYDADELLRRFDLEAKADVSFCSLSSGLRQRVFLAMAVVNRPALLVLDEPTAGLDPHQRRGLRDLIVAMRAEGRTVLLSTHDLEEAAQVCDQVAIIDRGRIVAVAPPAGLIARAKARPRVVVRSSPPLTQAAVSSLVEVDNSVYRDGGWVLETAEPNRLLAQLARCAGEERAELLDVQLRRPSLEDVFIELTGRAWTPADPGVSP